MNHCPRIHVKIIDPKNQRFGEVGDWFYDADDNVVTVFVSRMNDWRSELAVALHEIFESVSCIADNVDQTDVDSFDKKFHQENKDGEAGDSKDAPYFKQHKGATVVEAAACAYLNLSWFQHDSNCK